MRTLDLIQGTEREEAILCLTRCLMNVLSSHSRSPSKAHVSSSLDGASENRQNGRAELPRPRLASPSVVPLLKLPTKEKPSEFGWLVYEGAVEDSGGVADEVTLRVLATVSQDLPTLKRREAGAYLYAFPPKLFLRPNDTEARGFSLLRRAGLLPPARRGA
jgi:hypothetical protein